MAEVPVPFTGEEIDTSDGGGDVAMKIGLITAGFGVLAMARGVGGALASTVNNKIAQITGYDPLSGQSTGGDVV